MKRFDVCVIGGGPAGYAAAMRALDYGKKVLLIEKDKIGGAGIYNGVLASKTLWELSKDVAHARKRVKKYANNSDFKLDFEQVKKELSLAISERAHQLESHLDALDKVGFQDLFTLIKGTGKLTSKHEVHISTAEREETIWAEYIILATGSRPRRLAHIPIDEKIIVTSDGIHHLETLPKSMVVLGAGVIGCEYATIFCNLGETKVSIIDKAEQILPFEDDDISLVIEQNFEKEGIHIHHNAQLVRMEIINGQVEYELEYNSGTKEVYHVEKALVAVGRVPNVENLGLQEIGVTFDARGNLINDDTQTSIPNIYAIGDITADISLVNIGELEGRHAIEKIYGGKTTHISYDNISSIMFLNPIVASVGINEKQARAKNIPYKVVSIDYSCITRAIAMRNTQGFFKILVTHDDEMRILGMRAAGAQASSAIQAVALLISMGKGIQELAELIHPHPSLIEGIQECCRILLGTSIFKPSVFRDKMVYKGFNNADYCDLYQPGIRVESGE